MATTQLSPTALPGKPYTFIAPGVQYPLRYWEGEDEPREFEALCNDFFSFSPSSENQFSYTASDSGRFSEMAIELKFSFTSENED